MSSRTGRNYRFDAFGNALTAGLMGLAGQYLAKSAIFLGLAALCIPALIALFMICSDEIDYARARNAGSGKQAKSFQRLFDLGKNRTLYIFAGCVFMFQLADASMLPVVGQESHRADGSASLLMAGLIVVPQILVALLSPWVGYYSEKWGRKPLLLVGLALTSPGGPVCVLYRLYRADRWSIAWWNQPAAVTVVTVLVITDLTTGTGRFNLVRGSIGTVIAVAASVSTTATELFFRHSGIGRGF